MRNIAVACMLSLLAPLISAQDVEPAQKAIPLGAPYEKTVAPVVIEQVPDLPPEEGSQHEPPAGNLAMDEAAAEPARDPAGAEAAVAGLTPQESVVTPAPTAPPPSPTTEPGR